MCIVLITTAHPDYSLIVLDNRDEFILRPTSRPHWWKSASSQNVLSARDLQRAEQGTWMGVTESGKFAVLTNYRESDAVEGTRSRGAMVNECLTGPEEETTERFVKRLLASDIKGVGGFSLVCGNVRRKNEGERPGVAPLAIVSNRSSSLEKVAWIAGERGSIYALSNAIYGVEWPKVRIGKELLRNVLNEHEEKGLKEEELIRKFWEILDHDTLPSKGNESFEEYIAHLRESVFIHALGGKAQKADGAELKADEIAAAGEIDDHATNAVGPCRRASPAKEASSISDEVYGTQRQTIMLVDWNGKCSYIERALWDEQGNTVPRGEGDLRFDFHIKAWEEDAR